MRIKKSVSLVIAVFVSLLLIACGSAAADDKSSATTAAEKVDKTVDTPSEEPTDATRLLLPENKVTGDITREDAFVVWGWNTDFEALEDLLTKKHPEYADRLVFVNCGGSATYQDKIDDLLGFTDDRLYPDLILLEAGYVQKYVLSDDLLPLSEVGITSADLADQFQYNIDLGSDKNGVQKASFWQATPGAFCVRADLAGKWLDTTDREELQKIFSSWDSILGAAKKVNEASGGKVKLFAGYDDLKYIFLNGSRSQGWYDESGTIKMDDAMKSYMEFSKELYSEKLTYNTDMWSPDWEALKDGDGEQTDAALAFCGCPWYTYWCLTDTWNGNTILVDAPVRFYWGGTGLAATKGCSDKEMAGQIIKDCTCDKNFMIKIFQKNGDFVNNTASVHDIVANKLEGTSPFKAFGDQSIPEFFLTRGDGIDVSLVRPEDADINEIYFPAAVRSYVTGEKDLDVAIKDFSSSVHDRFPDLKAE
ncbi:MAG: hypothetical protein E7300_07850 [Lachnospiraceae bacterium]|nr:hypothetical protein [Lachnospiraceae bacterium]